MVLSLIFLLVLSSQVIYSISCTPDEIKNFIENALNEQVRQGKLSQDKVPLFINHVRNYYQNQEKLDLFQEISRLIESNDFDKARNIVESARSKLSVDTVNFLNDFINKKSLELGEAKPPLVISTLDDLDNALNFYKKSVFYDKKEGDPNLEARVIQSAQKLGISYDSVPVVFENKQYSYYYNRRMPSSGALSVDAAMDSIITELRARQKPVLITIDGRPGTGKSWFAKKLKGKLYNEFKPEVVSRDKAENRDVLESQVISALRKNNVVIVEGVYTNDLSFDDISVVNVMMETGPETTANNIIYRPKRAEDARLMLEKSQFDNILFSESIDESIADIVVWNDRELPKEEAIESPRAEPVPLRLLDDILADREINVEDLEALARAGVLRKAEGKAGIVYISREKGIVVKVNKLEREIDDPKYSEDTARQQLDNELSMLQRISGDKELSDKFPKVIGSKETVDKRIAIIETYVAGETFASLIETGELTLGEFSSILKRLDELQSTLSGKGLYFIDWNAGNIMVQGRGSYIEVKLIDLGQASRLASDRNKDVTQLKFYMDLTFREFFQTNLERFMEQQDYESVNKLFSSSFLLFGNKGRIVQNSYIQQSLEGIIKKGFVEEAIDSLLEQGKAVQALELLNAVENYMASKAKVKELRARILEATEKVVEKQVPRAEAEQIKAKELVVSPYSDVENCSSCKWPKKGQPPVSVAMGLSKESVYTMQEEMIDWVADRLNVDKNKVILNYIPEQDVLTLNIIGRDASSIENEFEALFLSAQKRISEALKKTSSEVRTFLKDLNIQNAKRKKLIINSGIGSISLSGIRALVKLEKHKEYEDLFSYKKGTRTVEEFKSMFESYIPNEVVIEIVKTIIETQKYQEHGNELVYVVDVNKLPKFRGLLDLVVKVVVDKDSRQVVSFYPIGGRDSYKLVPKGQKDVELTISLQEDVYKDEENIADYVVFDNSARLEKVYNTQDYKRTKDFISGSLTYFKACR